MTAIVRDRDIVLGYRDLELLHCFKNFPVFMGCTDEPAEQDIVHDMNICISQGTGMLQLNPVLPLDVVYQKEHDSGTTGAGWIEHHRSLAEFISRYNPSSVFEIGGAHGILNAEYCTNHGYVTWRILESNPSPVPGCGGASLRHVRLKLLKNIAQFKYCPSSCPPKAAAMFVAATFWGQDRSVSRRGDIRSAPRHV